MLFDFSPSASVDHFYLLRPKMRGQRLQQIVVQAYAPRIAQLNLTCRVVVAIDHRNGAGKVIYGTGSPCIAAAAAVGCQQFPQSPRIGRSIAMKLNALRIT